MEAIEQHSFNHFSHQHPLELTLNPSDGNVTCNGCNLRTLSGKGYYDCKTCSFSLHGVCSNMPRKTRHPSHPNHYLTLSVSPQSAPDTLKCKACRNSISGFYYSCGDCGIYCHILCLALPLSVAIATHPHTLKMEFSPPYDFNCDLCNKPSYKGWLYRCRFCEFDVHVSCAISNQKPQPLLAPETLTRQIIYSSASFSETSKKIDYGSEGNELMKLLVKGVTKGNGETNDQEVLQSAVVGWDERLRSPKENINAGHSGLHQTKTLTHSTCSSPGSGTRDQTPSTTISEDLTIPSYQFSDFCFSIDLLKSFSSSENKYAGSKDTSYQDIIIVPEVEAKISLPRKDLDDGHRMPQLGHTNKPAINPLSSGTENWLEAAPYDEKFDQNEKKKMEHGYGSRSRSRLIEQNRISANASSGRFSCWLNLFKCCYSSTYKKFSKSFKIGGP